LPERCAEEWNAHCELQEACRKLSSGKYLPESACGGLQEPFIGKRFKRIIFCWHNLCPFNCKVINLLLMKTNIRFLVLFAVMFSVIANVSAQTKTKKVAKYGEVYELSEKINGVYIPKDMEDAIRELDRILSAEEKAKLKEVESGIDLHFSLGMWLRNNWGLWANSRLVANLEKMGIVFFDADGISSHICCAYLDHLKGKKYVPEKREVRHSGSNKDFVVDESSWNYIGNNRKKFMEKGIAEGKRVKFGYRYGFSSGMEEQTVKELGNLREPEGIITDVNYYNRHYKVRLIKSYSQHGIVIFDGNVKMGNDGKYNLDKNYARSFTGDPSVFFMQNGDEVWFNISDGMWTIVE
jgi:hypothetical protein